LPIAPNSNRSKMGSASICISTIPMFCQLLRKSP
jgi:hypothetical protein